MARPEDDFCRSRLAHFADYRLVLFGRAVDVEEEDVGIVRIEIALCRPDEVRGSEAAYRAVLDFENCGWIPLLQLSHYVRVPALLYDGLPVEQHPHMRRIGRGGLLERVQRALYRHRRWRCYLPVCNCRACGGQNQCNYVSCFHKLNLKHQTSNLYSNRTLPQSRGSTPACVGRSLIREVALLLQ